MPDRTPTRRAALQTLATTALAATPLAGCLESEDRTPSDPTQSSTPSPTPTQSTAAPAIADWTHPDERPYAVYVPRKRFDHVPFSPASISGDRRAARKHEAAFGDGLDDYRRRWRWFPDPLPAQVDFTLSHTVGGVVVGPFDGEEYAARFERQDAVEHLGQYRGVSMYRDGDAGLGVAIADGLLATTNITRKPHLIESLEHHVDVATGNTVSYYRYAPEFEAVVELLPQGIFTELLPGRPPGAHSFETTVAGQTIHVDGDRSPATGRTVLRFQRDVDSRRERVADYVSTASSLWMQPFHEPTITMADDRTVVVEDRVDPSVVFGPASG